MMHVEKATTRRRCISIPKTIDRPGADEQYTLAGHIPSQAAPRRAACAASQNKTQCWA
jgi:hypothetical protein